MQLPDGKLVTVGNERFRCAEVLFNPSLINVEQPSISELEYNAIWKTDIHCRADRCCNLILDGIYNVSSALLQDFQSDFKKSEHLLYHRQFKSKKGVRSGSIRLSALPGFPMGHSNFHFGALLIIAAPDDCSEDVCLHI
ncbi:ACT-like protein, partial [Mya arenaria]